MNVRHLIIGAGPTGLGAAWRLEQRGINDWLVLEASHVPGVLAQSIVDEHGFTWDLGAHVPGLSLDLAVDVVDTRHKSERRRHDCETDQEHERRPVSNWNCHKESVELSISSRGGFTPGRDGRILWPIRLVESCDGGGRSVHQITVTRRQFTRSIAAAGGLLIFSRQAAGADFEMRQYHNQLAESPLHRRLVEMWAAVKTETAGRVEVRVFPENNRFEPNQGNPLDMLIRGELEFYTTSGNGLASLVPPAEVQTTPFAFRTREQVFRAIDGDIGDYLRAELRAKGIHAIPYGGFENGFHQFTTATRPIRTAADLKGLKLRAPGSPAYLDFFRMYGAVTTSMNISRLYEILKDGTVEAQEDPLDIVELLKLYEVQRYVSITNHSWSGYNLLANLKVWERLPADIRQAIERNARTFVRLQRDDMETMNTRARNGLVGHGMMVNETDVASFRPQLPAFYARWKQHIGLKAWNLLEGHVGRLG